VYFSRAYVFSCPAEEPGRVARTHRKGRRLTLETFSGPGNLRTRFLFEFERGKEPAEIGMWCVS